MKVNLQNAAFVRSAAGRSDFISDSCVKIAFAGRSNVGKSSTINAILNRKSLARVSESPGKTANVNYFLIDKQVYFCDLPGYGFARVAKQERERWGAMMEEFFSDVSELSLCVLLVDLRHKPTADDVTMCDFFKKSGVPFIVGANKLDNVKKLEREPNMLRVRETLELGDEVPVICYSAKKREGIDVLLGHISGVWERET